MKLSCDCKNIEITLAPPAEMTICNCHICNRYQALWGYYLPENVQIDIGHFGIDVYLRGDKEIEFTRCANCGCVTHYQSLPNDENPILAVNFRMSQDDLEGIPLRYFNGRDK